MERGRPDGHGGEGVERGRRWSGHGVGVERRGAGDGEGGQGGGLGREAIRCSRPTSAVRLDRVGCRLAATAVSLPMPLPCPQPPTPAIRGLTPAPPPNSRCLAHDHHRRRLQRTRPRHQFAHKCHRLPNSCRQTVHDCHQTANTGG